eukprot:CAMPEP_0175964126 /NCGR_PEP_ID=MMETSP0108-20121206/37394_1 /TAXON_ID=195067 ORGANISM="Goniomonas pacifica, Strain CCMP1869" /NCGR_SAMPLE_ID=MMETSP0108 /ASSEMBLY_ACC=CAM_ASM_000204 /LENGTH=704 /DNA_ID=CAMNT_0017292085 /DNA_START=6 /DNA_END=2120 /DNA_ORIENTATION=-
MRLVVLVFLLGAAVAHDFVVSDNDVVEDAQFYEGDPAHQFDDVNPSDLTNDLDVESEATWGRNVQRRVGYAVGDPHFRTLDGVVYHFQSVGQFVISEGPTQTVQGRQVACGKHHKYGYVTCYEQAAVKFSNPKTKKTSIVQVSTRGRCNIKLNGKDRKDNKEAFTTPAGSEVRPSTLTVAYYNGKAMVNYKVCMVKILNPDGSGVYVAPYAVITIEPVDTGVYVAPYAVITIEPVDHKTKGMMGNNDGNKDNEFVNGKSGVVYNNIKTAADRLDNGNTGQALHEWGLSWEVDDDKFTSIFDDKAAKYNKPQFKPGEFPFTNKTFKAEAHAACLNSALTMDFYKDCMFDCAATNSLQDVARDAEANEMFKEMKEKHKNYHKGKAALIRTLMKMNVEFKVEQRHIKEASEAQAEEVNKLKNHFNAAKDQQGVSCGAVHRVRAHLDRAKKDFDKADGAKNYIDKKWTAALEKWQKDSDQNKNEQELIGQMKTVLSDLVNVRTTSDLQIDQNQLAMAPKLRETFQELIDRAHEGHTDRVGVLLDQILANLAKEKADMDKDLAELKAQRQKIWARHAECRRAVNKGEADLAKQKRECARAKAHADSKYAEYKEGLQQQTEDEEERATLMEELKKEVEMIESLKETITNWSSGKKFGHCKTGNDLQVESEDADAGVTEAEASSVDEMFPVEKHDDDVQADLESLDTPSDP